jgi:GR25 family glycosyltransferase involved in LPS biosynthesis
MNKAKKKGSEILNEYYDKIYVITIHGNLSTRMEKLKKNLAGLNYDIYMGVEGKLLSKKEIDSIYNDDAARNIFKEYCKFSFDENIDRSFTLGEIGCTISHMNIYREMIEKGYNRVLILEDDSKLMFQYEELIPKIIEELPDKYDIFYWGYRWNDSESKLSRMKRKYFITPINFLKPLFGFTSRNINDRFPKPYKKYVWHAGYHCGGHAYGITRFGAEKILEINTPIIMMPDQLFAMCSRNKTLNSFVSVPLIFREDQTLDSSIAKSK